MCQKEERRKRIRLISMPKYVIIILLLVLSKKINDSLHVHEEKKKILFIFYRRKNSLHVHEEKKIILFIFYRRKRIFDEIINSPCCVFFGGMKK